MPIPIIRKLDWALELMRDGSRLIVTHMSDGEPIYSIEGHGAVTSDVFTKLLEDPRVQPCDPAFAWSPTAQSFHMREPRPLPLALPPTSAELQGAASTSDSQEDIDMDMRRYAGTGFLKLSDVKNAPFRGVIVDCTAGQYGPDLEFECGRKLTLNVTNVVTLMAAYGDNSDAWIGNTIEIYAGEVEYKGEMVASALVRSVSPPTVAQKTDTPPPKKQIKPKPKGGDMAGVFPEDDVPFA